MSRLFHLILFILLGFPYASVWADHWREAAKGAAAGAVGAVELTKEWEKVDGILKKALELPAKGGWGGCAVSVVSQGKVVFNNGYGKNNRDDGKEVTPETRFVMASTSKPITALGIFLLKDKMQREGKGDLINLRLDEIFGKRFANSEVAGIRVHELLRHTSRLQRSSSHYLPKNATGRPNDCAVAEGLKRCGRSCLSGSAPLEPAHRPMEPSYNYSNAGYAVLGCILSHLSGRSLNDYFREELFDKLGMSSTSFVDPAGLTNAPDMAYGRMNGTRASLSNDYWPATLADGGMVSTSTDLTKLSRLFESFEDGDGRYLSPESFRQMLQTLPAPYGQPAGGWPYANGWSVQPREQFPRQAERTYYQWHGGNCCGFTSHLQRISRSAPPCRLWISIACNRDDTSLVGVAREIERTYCR